VIAAVLGSVTPPGRLHRAVQGALARSSAPSTFLDLAALDLPFAGQGEPDLSAIAQADAVLLATPVYRGTYTGALKNLLDLLPVEALQGKPVGIVAMGATDHHSLGVDWHLRDTLAWFGALTLPTSVYLTSRDHDSERASSDLDALLAALVTLARVLPPELGPVPLAARRR
jgi:FMN reductase